MMSMPDSWNIQPGVYAVVAATAVLAGVFRSSISLVSHSLIISIIIIIISWMISGKAAPASAPLFPTGTKPYVSSCGKYATR